MTRRRVVITGLGGVTALGIGMQKVWEGLISGKSGVRVIDRFDAKDLDTRFAAQVWDYRPEDFFPKVESKKLDLFSQYALVAADEALRDSGLKAPAGTPPAARPDRVGVILGSGIGGIVEIEAQDHILMERGPSRLSPFFIPKMMVNAMSAQISIKYGFEGTNFATGSACSSSAHAMGMALRAVQYDEADVIVTGGSEATITPLSIGGFCALKALSTRNDDPPAASRPFDKERDGFVMGEGAAVLVFEELAHARRRGAKIYAEVKGYGSTGDAYHITAPKEDGEGPKRAMALALKDAQLAADAVDYVNAHGTSTAYNDAVETTALKRAFGDHARRLQISSTKSMIGHLLGASGAIELAVTALSVHHNIVHPTRNLTTPDPACDLDYIPGAARDLHVRNAMSNSLGFGGHNVSLVIGKQA
ncbi:MAG: beta-ketoacyl-ACP synthase II [Planctomycetota bacterium]